MKDREFLCWIHERLAHQLGDSPLTDFMHKLRAVIKAIPPSQETANTGSYNSLEELQKAIQEEENEQTP